MAGGKDGSLDETVPSTDGTPSQITRTTGPVVAQQPPVERGTAIGRYVALEPLGAGTMGTVVAAYDASLDRKIALKLVHFDPTGTSSGRERLLREAQAMAKLSHPNVVGVFEVGTFEDRVFLAMEYVAGSTLSEWLAHPRRTQREIIDAFVAAGRGLAAAHRAGIVHRDFKPTNVLVDKDGRVRVADFGLATANHDEPIADLPDTLRDHDKLAMTRTGAVLGTPAYMSPEQHRGEPADARADQYAFCVALYQALYRELPFTGETFLAYHEEVLAGRVRAVPRGSDVPARIRRVLLRGMSLAPGDRFPDMSALLGELQRDPAAARRRAALVGIATLIVGGVAFAAVRTTTRDPCAAAGDSDGAVWNAAARATVEHAFVSSGAPGAATAFERVDHLFAQRAVALREARHDACVATEVRHEQSADLLDRRMQCLDERTSATSALVAVLAEHPDAAVIVRSVDAVLELPPLEPCADRAVLLGKREPPPAAIAGRVSAFDHQLDRMRALADAGRWGDETRFGHEIAPALDSLQYAPLSARLHYLLADAAVQLRLNEQAVIELHRVADLAAASHDDDLLARSWIVLYGILDDRFGRTVEANALEPVAVTAVTRAGADAELRGILANTRGMVALSRGDYAKSASFFREALDAYGPKSMHAAGMLTNLSTSLTYTGNFDEALAAVDRALALNLEKLGPDHPEVGQSHYRRAAVLDEIGKPDEALREFLASATISAKSYPKDSVHIAQDYVSIGVVLDELGRPAEALKYHEQALAIMQLHPDDNRREMNVVLFDMGNTYRELHRRPEAKQAFERALALAEVEYGTDSASASDALTGLGIELSAQGDKVHAQHDFERALQIRLAKLGANHPSVAEAYDNLADMALERKDYRTVIDLADKGLAVLDRSSAKNAVARFYLLEVRAEAERGLGQTSAAASDAIAARDGFLAAHEVAEASSARLTLANVRWAEGDHRAAQAEANQTLAELTRAKEQDPETIGKARDWLAKHR